MNDGIQFELRKRSQRQVKDLWSVYYDVNNGSILNIEPNQSSIANALTVSYAKIKDILSGKLNQNDFKVQFNEKISALDLVNTRRPNDYKKKRQTWYSWLSQAVNNQHSVTDLTATLFVEHGFLRVECSREWGQRHRENHSFQHFDLYLSDSNDPHQIFGYVKVSMHDLIERGFWEKRLWSFMDHELVKSILFHGQQIRINIPPVADSLRFVQLKEYYAFSGVVDDKTLLTHPGPGKHITVFVKDKIVWAQSHYTPGSALDSVQGNIRAALIWKDDPDNFLGWVELPGLLLRETIAFELVRDWQADLPPNLLYKANNIDIGVI